MKIFSARGRLRFILVILIGLFLAYSTTGERGFVRFGQMARQKEELKARVRDLQRTNAGLAEEISDLRDDPATIENLARTELGMVRDGETVYILNERPGDDAR